MKKTVGRKVSFQVTAEPGSEVFVAGTFNNWDPRQHRMKDNPGSGHCKTTLVLPPGRHEYKFVVNGEWRVDPDCPEWAPNDQGSLNSVITV
jgi:1,4-alpha-glucan branching enzyme